MRLKNAVVLAGLLSLVAGAAMAQGGGAGPLGGIDPGDLTIVIYEPQYVGAPALARLLGGSVLYLNEDLLGGGRSYGRGGYGGYGNYGGYGGYGGYGNQEYGSYRGGYSYGGRGSFGSYGGRGNYGYSGYGSYGPPVYGWR